jgi:hypothetical protein
MYLTIRTHSAISPLSCQQQTPTVAEDAFDELDLDSMNIVESGSRAINVADPFQKRAGKTLLWTNVNMTLQSKTGDRKLLENVWGEVPAGETTAIMGAFISSSWFPCFRRATMVLTVTFFAFR